MLRSAGLVLALTLAAVATGPAATALPSPGDRLTLTVAHSGDPAADGTSELRCHPAGGTHPAARAACDRLDGLTRWGSSPFAPVPRDAHCTRQYGGPATARLTGTWAGRPVDATFDRADGCEISRWQKFEPVLPHVGG